MADMKNLDAVKIEYRKVTGMWLNWKHCSSLKKENKSLADNINCLLTDYSTTARSQSLGWTPAVGQDNEVINFKIQNETNMGIATAVWDISSLDDFE